MRAPPLLMGFYGDDFTGSTDALEALARAGVRTVLFTRSPSPEQLSAIDGMHAFGIAGRARAMTPDEMVKDLTPAFIALKQSGASIVHYKVCSTFDSSPVVGSIGKAIEIARQIFGNSPVPVVGGAPSLGRYCLFGNLFAEFGSDGEVFRLDRHPSMRRHPTTPMTESDLRLHLAHQTTLPIGLLDTRAIDSSPADAAHAYRRLVDEGNRIILFDLAHARQLATVGGVLADVAAAGFVAGSSAVEEALCACWRDREMISGEQTFAPVTPVRAILVICGSCSPVTAGQIAHAVQNGFAQVVIQPDRLDESSIAATVSRVATTLIAGQSVIVHTDGADRRQPLDSSAQRQLGTTLGRIAAEILTRARLQRIIVAGGDTSGLVADALQIEALQMIAPLVRGVPLCRAKALHPSADGLEIAFKGGQIGPPDFFSRVQQGQIASTT